MTDNVDNLPDATAEAAPPAGAGVEATIDQPKGGNEVSQPATQPSDTQDWRDRFAGEDKEFKEKTLSRFASEADFAKAYKALRTKLSSGELTEKLPDNPTPEALSAWRKSNGIPETPADYKIELSGGRVIGESDKAFLGKMTEQMHSANMTPNQVNSVIDAYYNMQEEQSRLVADFDAGQSEKIESELREEWQGKDYKVNHNIIGNLGAKLGDDFMKAVLERRDPETGRLGKHDPIVMKTLAMLGRELNPISAIVNMEGGATSPESIQAEKAKIRDVMRNDRQRYNADTAMQERYRELLAFEEQAKR